MNLEQMGKQLRAAVDRFCLTLDDGFRDHLGASEIGHPCERALWYGFRWINRPTFEGDDQENSEEKEARMRRLFARGHAEEDRLVSILRGAGARVETVDPATGKQFKILGVGGHFSGSLDGFIWFSNWPRAVLEMKTHSVKSYDKLRIYGNPKGQQQKWKMGHTEQTLLEKSKPKHVAQMNTYGTKSNTEIAVYVPMEKDSDSLDCIQVRKVDRNAGVTLEQKAERIIRSQLPLAKLHHDQANFDCKFCDHRKTCHEGAPISELNCRSCKHAEPMPGPRWRCNDVGEDIPADVIPKGCPHYQPIETQRTAR